VWTFKVRLNGQSDGVSINAVLNVFVVAFSEIEC